MALPPTSGALLTAAQHRQIAGELLLARARRETLSGLSVHVETDADAYAIQDEFRIQPDREHIGWKIGATSAFAQEFLGADGPFAGPMFANGVYKSGAEIPAAALHEPKMEPEIAVVMETDLAPQDTAYTVDDVTAAVSTMRPAVELVGGCFADITACGVRALIADLGANAGIVLGAPIANWAQMEPAAVPIALHRDGTEMGSGTAADALGGPLHALTWLANHLAGRGLYLRAGQTITNGTCGGVALLPIGSTGLATYGSLGEVVFSYGIR